MACIKVILDDTWRYIEFEETSIRCNCSHQFKDAIEVILTENQQEKFIGNDTERTFNVSKKRIARVKNLLKINLR